MLPAAAPAPPGEPGRPTFAGWLVELLLATLPLDLDRARAGQPGAQLLYAPEAEDEVRDRLAVVVPALLR